MARRHAGAAGAAAAAAAAPAIVANHVQWLQRHRNSVGKRRHLGTK